MVALKSTNPCEAFKERLSRIFQLSFDDCNDTERGGVLTLTQVFHDIGFHAEHWMETVVYRPALINPSFE